MSSKVAEGIPERGGALQNVTRHVKPQIRRMTRIVLTVYDSNISYHVTTGLMTGWMSLWNSHSSFSLHDWMPKSLLNFCLSFTMRPSDKAVDLETAWSQQALVCNMQNNWSYLQFVVPRYFVLLVLLLQIHINREDCIGPLRRTTCNAEDYSALGGDENHGGTCQKDGAAVLWERPHIASI